jgi:hypothetical protein
VAEVVEADEAFGPGGVAVLGTGRVQADPAGAAEAVEKTGRFGEGQLAEIEAEDVAVEEDEGGVGLFEAGEGVLFGVGEVFEESADVGEGEVAGVAFVVEEDESANPEGEAIAGPVLAETSQGGLADEVEETGWLRRM